MSNYSTYFLLSSFVCRRHFNPNATGVEVTDYIATTGAVLNEQFYGKSREREYQQ